MPKHNHNQKGLNHRLLDLVRGTAKLDMSNFDRCVCFGAYCLFRIPAARRIIRRCRFVTHVRLAGTRDVWIRLGSTDIAVFYEIFVRGEYSQHVEEIERHVPTSANPMIVDLGANVGLATIYFQLRYPGATLLCVEPESENYLYLKRNATASSRENHTTFVRALVGDAEGVGYLQSDDSGEWGFTLVRDHTEQSAPTPIIDLRSLLERSGRTHVDILKCDIEGSEVELMRSICTWGPMVKSLIIELHPTRGYDKKQFENDLLYSGTNWKILDTPAAQPISSQQPIVVSAVRFDEPITP